DWIRSNGWDRNIPIPLNAQPPGAEDGSAVVVSPNRDYVWEFRQFKNLGSGKFQCDVVYGWDLTGDGVDCPPLGVTQINNKYAGRSRMAGTPKSHGMIMYEEIKRGRIDHALAFAYWGNDGGEGVYPSCIWSAELNPRQWALKSGMRLQLDPNLDLDALGLNRAGKIIARALQEYGMIFVENNGPNNNAVYAESLNGKEISWDDPGPDGAPWLRPSDTLPLPLSAFRVVEPIYVDDAGLGLNINTSANSGTAPLEVAFSAIISGGTPPYIFSWDFGDGSGSNATSPTHVYLDAGEFSVNLSITDNTGQQVSASKTITVQEAREELFITDINITPIGHMQALNIIEKETWYEVYVAYNRPLNELSEMAFTQVWLNSPSYTEGTVENKGGVFLPTSNYVMSFSIEGSSEEIWARQTESSTVGTKITGKLGLYVDDSAFIYEINVAEGWAKAKVKLLDEAETGTWTANAFVKINTGQTSDLYREAITLQENTDAPLADIALNAASPLGPGTVTLSLTTSKAVTSVPTQLTLHESDGSETVIPLDGPVPGNNFSGSFDIDNTIADGSAHLSLAEGALVDEYGNLGNEIISGKYLKIDKTPPSQPRIMSGEFNP
ncbi:PKD domain-containing protein, partial [candidate division KSB1 bacterium]|nr:PKD domain-containing protein [candidate division KSB1 bacterium]NIR71071.1 PKD domain-containing protein [candidate division KSB1 bacterium]NIS24775.1 PKD domain-containing protein [candidate division KSB1 bacterium]NIT71680.1 PKD domain-containing protein [candidate division KSB1 bacterium]NIU25387.1 PKD domain-containing protein [candidate division KSB1 bacterium]